METLNKILNYLPFNGNKTNIGLLLTILAFVQAIAATPDGQALVSALTTKPIDWVAVTVLVIGIVHKYLKTKYTSGNYGSNN